MTKPTPAVSDYPVAVIVPTVGDASLAMACVQRMLETTTVPVWQLVMVVNPVPAFVDNVDMLHAQIAAMCSAYNEAAVGVGQVVLSWVMLPAAAGWTGAVNAGIDWLMQEGLPDIVVVMNDDVLTTPGWLARMANALDPQKIVLQGEVGMYGDDSTPRDAAAFGRIGMVGPCSNNVAGVQKVEAPEVRMANGSAFTASPANMLDGFGNTFQRKANPYPMAASFLSGLCVCYRRECIVDLLEKHDVDGAERWCLLNPVYGTGGYDDNDVAVRAARLGWKLAIACNVYVHHIGHQTLDKHFPESRRGLANAATYLRRWEKLTNRDQRVVAVYRVGWEVPWDLQMLGKSVRRMAGLVDGIALLATSSPAVVTQTPEWPHTMGQLAHPEAELVTRAADAGANTDRLMAALELYLLAVVESLDLPHEVQVAAGVWDDGGTGFNERDERNGAIDMAMLLQPDWLISVDHDEVPEDRITREHLQRLARHPDPGVTHYDVGWLNHWDSPRLMRVDAPWCHGYSSSMRGFRLWRAGSGRDRILAGNERGLHCGNVPDAGEGAKRVAAFRFRHYGYLRPQDRIRKYERYMRQDPQPDGVLTQAGASKAGSYRHLVNEEGMKMQPYVAQNSIGLTMLWHEGESAHDLMRWLDLTYGLVDYAVMVWTGPADTAPSEEMQYIAARFGARWTHHPLNDNLGAARNAGVDALRELGAAWCWVMDPDEYLAPAFSTAVSVRRMAEVSDSWAWMFRFRNHRPDGKFNWSENTRMFRLAEGVLRFNNRVHETLEHSLAELGKRGVHPEVRFAPFAVEHFGLRGGDAQTQQKLVRYTRLLAMQLQDAPLASSGAWVSLGLQYGNDGLYDEQWECYLMALRTAGNGYLPFREAALHRLRQGTDLLREAYRRLSPAHDLHKTTRDLIEVLMQQAPPQPKLGAARTGAAVPPDVQLDKLMEVAREAAAKLNVADQPLAPNTPAMTALLSDKHLDGTKPSGDDEAQEV